MANTVRSGIDPLVLTLFVVGLKFCVKWNKIGLIDNETRIGIISMEGSYNYKTIAKLIYESSCLIFYDQNHNQ